MHCKMKAKKKYGKGGKLYNKGGKLKKLGKRGTVGAPVSNKEVKETASFASRSAMDTALRSPKARFSPSGHLELGSKRDGRVQSNAKEYLKTIQKSQEVPNKALKKQTKKFNTGRSKADERTYYQGNPGGLKGRTSGKGGNVGAGVKVTPKKKGKKVKKAMNGMMLGADPAKMKKPKSGLKAGLLGAALGGGAALLAKKLIDKKKAAGKK